LTLRPYSDDLPVGYISWSSPLKQMLKKNGIATWITPQLRNSDIRGEGEGWNSNAAPTLSFIIRRVLSRATWTGEDPKNKSIVSAIFTLTTRIIQCKEFNISHWNSISSKPKWLTPDSVIMSKKLVVANYSEIPSLLWHWGFITLLSRGCYSKYVLVSSTLVGLATRYYFLSECCCLKFAVLLMWRALSDERTDLQFAV
jgi:hypothetical protein